MGGSKNRTLALIFVVFTISLGLILPLVSAANLDFVVMDKYGEPIDDATVVIENSTEDEVCDDDTDNDGEASCDGLPEDEDYDLFVTHDDYQDLQNTNDVLEDLDENLDIAIIMRPALIDVEIHVIDENGNDVEDADVTIESLDEDVESEDFPDEDDYEEFVFPDEDSEYEGFEVDSDDDEQETDEDGMAEFEDLESDTLYQITVEERGYITFVEEFELELNGDYTGTNDAIEIVLQEPGDAIFRVKVKDEDTNEPVGGARVVVVNRDTLEQEVLDTNGDGIAEFTLETPQCYDVLIRKERYSEASQTNICFNSNDDETIVYTIRRQNNPPIANAGEDLFILEGATINLDASGSSDLDGDTLTFVWIDSLGADIPSEMTPMVEFTTPGVHEITLTVSDGNLSDTDVVIVNVESLENCGNGICSIAENQSRTCPQDCPICLDNTCGVGEDDSFSSSYCPVDCGIRIIIQLRNTSRLVPGNVTTIVTLDENTGGLVPLATLSIRVPNGTVSILRTNEVGEVIFQLSDSGNYTISVSKDRYVSTDLNIVIEAPSEFGGIVLWVVIVIVIVLIVLFAIRIMNSQRGEGKGYRARRFKRRKSTLSGV